METIFEYKLPQYLSFSGLQFEWLNKIETSNEPIIYLNKPKRSIGMTEFLVKFCIMKLFDEKSEHLRIVFISPTLQMAYEVYRKFQKYFDNRQCIKTFNSKKIELKNGNSIMFSNQDPTRLRGYDFDWIVWDDSRLDMMTNGYFDFLEYVKYLKSKNGKVVEVLGYE